MPAPYQISDDGRTITCLRCGLTSHNSQDVKHRYCGHCRVFHEDASHPGYWMYETTGVLRPAVEAYLAGGPLTAMHVAAMRAYLRQWIAAPAWQGEEIDRLRADVDTLTSRAAIARWLDRAEKEGIDPL